MQLSKDLVARLILPVNRFRLNTVRNYYQDILGLFNSKFKFSSVTEELILQLLGDMNIDKAPGIGNISRKFLNSGANILAKPVSKICNLFIKYSLFPTDCQIAKLKQLFK